MAEWIRVMNTEMVANWSAGKPLLFSLFSIFFLGDSLFLISGWKFSLFLIFFLELYMNGEKQLWTWFLLFSCEKCSLHFCAEPLWWHFLDISVHVSAHPERFSLNKSVRRVQQQQGVRWCVWIFRCWHYFRGWSFTFPRVQSKKFRAPAFWLGFAFWILLRFFRLLGVFMSYCRHRGKFP